MVLSQWGKRWSAQEAAEGQSSGSDGALNDLPKPDKLARQQASEPHRADSARAPSSSAALGSGAEPSKPTSPGATAQDVTFAPTFIRIVSVLMRSPHYRHYALSHVEVVPLLLVGQYPVMDAKINEKRVPIAAALWASVSEDVDERLSENLTVSVRTSGGLEKFYG